MEYLILSWRDVYNLTLQLSERIVVSGFKPDVIVHINVDAMALEGKVKNKREFEYHQDVERTCALFMGIATGSGIKLIHCGLDGVRKAADELYDLLKNLMVKK